MAEPKAPTGGFKQGGWYEGRQYWNGTFSTPGVINSQSDQVGAGKAVSNEILASTSVAAGKAPDANQKYIEQQNKMLPSSSSSSAMSSPEDLSNFLNSYQDSLYESGVTGVAASLLPNSPKPETINRASIYEEKRADMGVDSLEQELNTLKDQERTILAQTREMQVNEEGKPVALGVMGGRINEQKRQAQIDLDFLNVRKSTLVDELTTKYNAINMYVNFAGLDYQDAKQAYDNEFSQNLQMAQFLSGEKQNAVTNARANLTTMMNLVTSGNMSYGDLSNDEKLQISKLEVQSGLPIGTISKIQIAPKDKILGFSDDKTQAMIMDGNGGFKVVSTGISKSTSSSNKTTEAQMKSEIKNTLIQDARSGTPLINYSGDGGSIMEIYRPYLELDEIYALYNTYSKHGPAKESYEELVKYKGVTKEEF